MNKISLFYVTFDTEESADAMIKQLVSEKLIACGNKIPINSIYQWEVALCDEHEIVAILKTSKENVIKTEHRIEELHPYDVPCIIHLEATCNDSYYKWILRCLEIDPST